MNRFKDNHDLLEVEQQEFAKGGTVLKGIFEVSVQHPLLSMLFILSFGMLTNALYDLTKYLTTEPEVEASTAIWLCMLSAIFALVPLLVFVRIRVKHPYVFTATPLEQKKILITMVSKREDFRNTPAYNTYESLLYNPAGHANPNALEKVILITSESPESVAAANALKLHIEDSGRTAEIFGITINDKSLLEIQKQFEVLYERLKKSYASHEIIADYTGGTKDMSMALLRTSEKALVAPVYLNEATTGNHSKY